MCEWDLSSANLLYIFVSFALYGKVLSCQFTEYYDKSKFMGINRNNIETPPGRVAEHLAEIHISYQLYYHIARKLYYGIVSIPFYSNF